MKLYSLCFTIVVMFNYLIEHVLAGNTYYMISIRRSRKDKEYDKVSKKVQNEIDLFVNDKMNDIYDIIADNKNTYIKSNGKLDKKLKELFNFSQLKKRNENEFNENIIYKIQFINRNRPQVDFNNIKLKKRHNNNKEKEVEYIPFESKLLIHICPVSNYYVIIAYLSDEIVNVIKSLPNVIECTKSFKTANYYSIDSSIDINTNSTYKYYDEEEILDKTNWKDVSIQENKPNLELKHTHLSLLSQGKYNESDEGLYDNNYYYPSTAGEGIDIFVIDTGLNVALSEDDFDTYKGESYERKIRCEGIIQYGIPKKAPEDKLCYADDVDSAKHGTLVSIAAVGKINGVAKRANLRVIATTNIVYDELLALDYIKQVGKPYKTVINISRGCEQINNKCHYQTAIQYKINELVEMGIIVIAAAGNNNYNPCKYDLYTPCKGVIGVGGINNKELNTVDNLENMYSRASQSNYGECIDIYAPFTLRVTDSDDNVIMSDDGTSFSSPMVAGLAATLMSEFSDIDFNADRMLKKLNEISLKDEIKGIRSGYPNLLANNGKNFNYYSPRCDDVKSSSVYYNDDTYKNKCCSKKNGYYIDPVSENSKLDQFCVTENGCLSEFGYCYDINDLNRYDKRHKRRICDVILPIKNCTRTIIPTNENSRTNSCNNNYPKEYCEELMDSPCESFLKEDEDFYYNYFYCAKKDPESLSSNDFCFNGNSIFEHKRLRNILEDRDLLLETSCQFSECRKSLVEFLKFDLVYHNEVLSKAERELYDEVIDYLSSDKECVDAKIEKCGKDKECGEGKCCSKYGVCVDTRVSKEYNDICLVKNGCISNCIDN